MKNEEKYVRIINAHIHNCLLMHHPLSITDMKEWMAHVSSETLRGFAAHKDEEVRNAAEEALQAKKLKH